MRTLETADIIAKITGLSVIPFAPIREIFKTREQIDEYKGLTLEEMREKYEDYLDEIYTIREEAEVYLSDTIFEEK